jgi:hypothetical protein
MSLRCRVGVFVGLVALRSRGCLLAVGRRVVVGFSARTMVARGFERPGSRWIAARGSPA